MDIYFKLKTLSEYVIPIVVILLIFIIGAIIITVSVIKEKRIKKFFESNGFKRELFDVPPFGCDGIYAWYRESDNTRVDDRDIEGLSLKEIKKKYDFLR